VDRTPYRRTFALWACYLLLAVNLAQGAVGASTWIFVAGLSVLSILFFLALQTAQFAYLPELSRDHVEVSRIAGKARAVELLGVCVFIAATLVVSAVAQKLSGAFNSSESSSSSGVAGSDGGDGGSNGGNAADLEVAVLRARVGQVCGVLLAAPSLIFAWHKCLGDRAPTAPRLSAAVDGERRKGGGGDTDDNDDDKSDTTEGDNHHQDHYDASRRKNSRDHRSSGSSSSGRKQFATGAASATSSSSLGGNRSGSHHSCFGLWSLGVRALADTCR